MTAQHVRPTRRLASLPARIVLFVCTSTLATAGVVGLPALLAHQRALGDHLDQITGEILATGEIPASVEGKPGSWELAILEADGDVRPTGDAGKAWDLPPGWPEALETLEDGKPSPTVSFADSGGVTWVMRAAPRPEGGWRLVRQPFEEAYAPLLELAPTLFAFGFASVFLFSFVAYWVTTAVVKPIELLAAEARRISQGDLHFDLTLPVRTDEVGLLTRTFNDMVRRLRRNQQQIEDSNVRLTDQNQQLQRANEILAQLSITDGLTRLHNHRFFQDQLAREIKRCERTGEPLGMILADIDDFKQLNDRHGHATGDEVLVRIAGVMNEAIRESDFLARYGGEEFAILTTGTDLEGAVTLAEKIRLRIAQQTWLSSDEDDPQEIHVTVSMGVAIYRGERKAFFRDADRALYEAKGMGKNCVVVDEESQRIAQARGLLPGDGETTASGYGDTTYRSGRSQGSEHEDDEGDA
jgi:diguanylate cyclase (GGDEF)-like protein